MYQFFSSTKVKNTQSFYIPAEPCGFWRKITILWQIHTNNLKDIWLAYKTLSGFFFFQPEALSIDISQHLSLILRK